MLASSQEIIAGTGSIVGASWSTTALKPTTEISASEAVEGEACSSLQITIVELDVASTRHRNPTPTPSTSGASQGTKADNNASNPRRKSGFPHLLGTISRNKKTGAVHERKERHLAKYQAIVEKYNNKRLGNQQRVTPTAHSISR